MPADPHTPCFIDSNIWLYAFVEQGEPQRQAVARQLLAQPEIVVSTQIVNEVCINLLKKAEFTEEQIRRLIRSFYQRYSVTVIDEATMLAAAELRGRYSFSFWDSLWSSLPHYRSAVDCSTRKTCSTDCSSMSG